MSNNQDNNDGRIEPSLTSVPFFEDIKAKSKKSILLAGCGGGFDIYCGIPLYVALRKLGRQVYLSNLTFTSFSDVDKSTTKELSNDLLQVSSESKLRSNVSVATWKDFPEDTDSTYFPELYLAQFLKKEYQEDVPVFMINRTAHDRMLESYKMLLELLDFDCIVLVDGGTDSLMRGDEEQLGTPHEDFISIAAVHSLQPLPNQPPIHKYLTCLGFGIDSFHGVSHALFLENVSQLIKDGAFLGTFSLLREMKEGQLFKQACEYAFERMETSIVNGSIVAAVEGNYGNYHFTKRTEGSTLWINPLMSMYWCFFLDGVAKNIYCLKKLKAVKHYHQLSNAIYGDRDEKPIRKPQNIPV